MTDPLGVYISVPFCKAKCTYCNFASGVFGADRLDRYVERMCAEIASSADAAARRTEELHRLGERIPQSADTIFFGGGTPSLLSAQQLRRLFAALRREFDVAADAEITLESAPGQLSDETLDEMLRQGMNRVSFGIQSFVDRESAAVGRLHTRDICLAEIRRVRAAGVARVNVDLIVGLPYQTAESCRESVDVAIQSGAGHVSVYMLEVDEDSRLGREMLAEGARYGAAAAPSEDETAEWYAAACEWLEAAGILQYEISNFARPGHASRHNVKYWRRQPYIGFGLDAHSMLRTQTGALRWANASDLDAYLAESCEVRGALEKEGLFRRLPANRPTIDVIVREQAFEEAMFLGLRMNEGVDLDSLRLEFDGHLLSGAMEAMRDVHDAGLIVIEQGRARLTAKGRMASNEVFSRLLVPVPA